MTFGRERLDQGRVIRGATEPMQKKDGLAFADLPIGDGGATSLDELRRYSTKGMLPG